MENGLSLGKVRTDHGDGIQINSNQIKSFESLSRPSKTEIKMLTTY